MKTVLNMLLPLTCILLLTLVSVSGTPSRQCICSATADGTGVNIRSCGSTDCGIVHGLADSSCLDFLGLTADDWLHVKTGAATTGWIHGGYVSGPQLCGGSGPYTFATLCASEVNNERRDDPAGRGHFNATRDSDSRFHKGLDIECGTGDDAYSPIDGVLEQTLKPFGNNKCCDVGYQIRGTGDWEGYQLKVFYTRIDSNRLGSEVKKGDKIGVHTGVLCPGCYTSPMTEHAHVRMYYMDQLIDPSSFAFHNFNSNGVSRPKCSLIAVFLFALSIIIATELR